MNCESKSEVASPEWWLSRGLLVVQGNVRPVCSRVGACGALLTAVFGVALQFVLLAVSKCFVPVSLLYIL